MGRNKSMDSIMDIENQMTDQPTIEKEEPLVSAGYYFLKRIMDILISFLVLIVLSPFLLIIAILIRLDSPGSAIYIQKRVGSIRKSYNHQSEWQQNEFIFYKFRTMVDGADSSIHKEFIKALIAHDEEKIQEINQSDTDIKKIKNDKRITRLGHFLRCYSLDELPQLWNVLIGEMSLIGPRPAIPYELEFYKPWYFRRFHAKPGLTGLWQVKARNSVDFDEMVKLDIEYVEHQSIWLDLKIMVLTPWVIIFHHEAAC